MKPLKIYFSYLVLLFLNIPITNAQLKTKIAYYSTQDGLSHNRIMCMLKDREGFMWFGTWDGLNRFDGKKFVVYKSKIADVNGLVNNRIQNMIEDKAGNLWLWTYDNSLYRFDKKAEIFKRINLGLTAEKNKFPLFERIFLTKEGQIWLTSKDQGVFLFNRPDDEDPKCINISFGTGRYKLPSNDINFFHQDKNHKVWIGTANGLACVSSNTKSSSIELKIPILGEDITAISGVADTLYLSAGSGHLYLLNPKNHRVLSSRQFGKTIRSIIASKDRVHVYAATETGQLMVLDRLGRKIKDLAVANVGSLSSLYEDAAGRLWMETGNSKVVKYDPKNEQFKSFFQQTDNYYEPAARFYKISEMNDGLIWVSMPKGGFGYYDPKTDDIDYFHNKPGDRDYRFSNIVVSSFFDSDGVIWLNTDDRGLNKIVIQKEQFHHFKVAGSSVVRSDNEVRGIFCDRKNRTWLASKSGKVYVQKGGLPIEIKYVNRSTEKLGVVYCINQQKNGTIWMGTKSDGLFKAVPRNEDETTYDIYQFKSTKNENYSLNNNSVFSILIDHMERVWIGTFGGGINLVNSDGNETQFINSQNQLKSYPQNSYNKIRHLCQDKKGRIWIGTTNGLAILEPNNTKYASSQVKTYAKIFGKLNSLSENDIQFITRDVKGNMWLATSGGGLNLALGAEPMKKLDFRNYSLDNGLNSDYILGLVQDNNGYLWLSTENGLSRFDISGKKFRNFMVYSGLSKTGFSEASAIKLPNGNLLFGCLNGFLTFDPKSISVMQTAAPMVLTSLQVNSFEGVGGANSLSRQNINQLGIVKLRHDQNFFTIGYNLLDYRQDDKANFLVRLKGLEKNWQANKDRLYATYTNLPAGKYTFEVKIEDPYLYTKSPYRSIDIQVLPPLWKTWWAYLIYFIIILILAALIRRALIQMVRLKHKVVVEQKMSELKTKFFTNVSHELRTPLTLILNPITELDSREGFSAQDKQHIGTVRRNAQRMVKFVNQLLDLQKVESGRQVLKLTSIDIADLVSETWSHFSETAIQKHIEISVLSLAEPIFVYVDKDKIEVVLFNLFANALKFCDAGKVITVLMTKNDEGSKLIIEVADQGSGVPEHLLSNIFERFYQNVASENVGGTGIGLTLAKEFLNLHQCNIWAANNIDGGLSVFFELPIDLGDVGIKEVKNKVANVSLESKLQLPVDGGDLAPDFSDLNRPKILLVEDNVELRSFLTFQLGKVYDVVAACNGEEGLVQAGETLPDLILSDIMMPKMDGVTMLDKLKNNVLTSHIPVILLTAKSSVSDQISGLKYGADVYITKPFDNELLMLHVSKLLENRKNRFQNMLEKQDNVKLEPSEIVITQHDEIFLKQQLEFVEQSMTDTSLNIGTMAAHANMGRSTFFNKFKSLTGVAPVEFIKEIRLKRAKQYLDAGQLNINEISELSGFSNAKYFSTCFKEHYGMTPSEYMKKQRS